MSTETLTVQQHIEEFARELYTDREFAIWMLFQNFYRTYGFDAAPKLVERQGTDGTKLVTSFTVEPV